jgi:hypothetical protein
MLEKGTLFAPELVADLFNKVAGHSTLAKLGGNMPVSFVGNEIFTFSMDDEIEIVAEGGKKSAGASAIEPVTIAPIKVVYQTRVSDEFLFASEEKKLEILKAFNDGYAKKVARGLDIMAIHGVNPRSKEASAVIGDNCFAKKAGITKVTFSEAEIEQNIEDAIAAVADNYDVTGMAMARPFSATLAGLTVNGVKQYPELGWGANPATVKGLPVDVNSTVNFNNATERAIVGDFKNAFKWGYAKQIPLEVIQYGDPDQTGKDLKAYNQVCLRAETYIGWGILDAAAFARIAEA